MGLELINSSLKKIKKKKKLHLQLGFISDPFAATSSIIKPGLSLVIANLQKVVIWHTN